MKIQSHIQIGDFHTNYCEDFLIIEQISSSQKLIAVMDGCTMGTESTFSSMLLGKVLRKVAREFYYQEFLLKSQFSNEELLKETFKLTFNEIKEIKNRLMLETNELLSTLIIGLIDEDSHKMSFKIIGDGLIVIDGNSYEFDQNDKPDYFGYHLNEDFDTWYQSLDQEIKVENIKDVSITTDGIFSFKNYIDKDANVDFKKIIQTLLVEPKGFDRPYFFRNRIDEMKQKENIFLTDDIAIIRMINK